MPILTEEDDIDRPPTSEDLQARSQYLQRLAGDPKPKRNKRPLLILLIILLVLVLAGAAFWLYRNHKTVTPITSTPKKSSNQTVKADAASNDTSAKTYSANGQDINLTFEYPGNWTAEPPSNTNSSDKPITVASPLTTITTASGQSTTGKVVMSIRPGNKPMDELSSGKATAAEKSEQFAYKSPSPNQYQYPFLVFMHLAAGANSTNGFEEVVVSGNTSFNKGDEITNDLLSPDPVISAAFYACATHVCTGTGATPLGITHDTWANAMIFQQTLAIFESLQIQ